MFVDLSPIKIPVFFTTDSDNHIDTRQPKTQEGFSEILTTIFDRYNKEIYQMTHNSLEWHGRFKKLTHLQIITGM